MARLKPSVTTGEPVLNAMRVLAAGGGPVVRDGEVVGVIVPDSLYDYGVPPKTLITAYQGDGDYWCAECLAKAWGENGETAEQALDRAAKEKGINRRDERTYDCADLPKPCTAADFEYPEGCCNCHRPVGRDPEEFRLCPDDACGGWVPGAEGDSACLLCGTEYTEEQLAGQEPR
jgi:hypothetical protein